MTDATIEAKKEEKHNRVNDLSPKMQDIIKLIETMNVLELSELVKALEKKFGVSAAAPVAVAGGAQGSVPIQAQEVKESADVVLVNAGAGKIQVIKEIRAVTTLGLKEAKDLVEGAPKTVRTDVPIKEAEEIKKKLEAAGAKVELK